MKTQLKRSLAAGIYCGLSIGLIAVSVRCAMLSGVEMNHPIVFGIVMFMVSVGVWGAWSQARLWAEEFRQQERDRQWGPIARAAAAQTSSLPGAADPNASNTRQHSQSGETL